MKTLLVAAALMMAGTPAALAQGYISYGTPYYGTPYVYDYAPGYVGAGVYAPGVVWYGYGDYYDAPASVRQPSPSSTIRAVR
ncbi:MAG TPA: hypothetical protein VMA30_14640 [Xanthobacteraceae bacterium]|nr:hypothetical protein [Xanthobacteraceae bacterium]